MNLQSEQEYKLKIEELQKEIADLKKKQTQKIKEQKYGLNWIDVPEAFEKESENKIPVLEEVKEKSIKSDDGKPTHILIEGDNYHALKCLNYTHAGKIDVIYIDPPYNIGKDFIYKDARFLEEFPDGTAIPKDHPLRHSSWLSFMSKRLKLAKNLLSETGVLFISIDDNECAQLKILCDQIFSADLFIGNIAWESKTKSQNTQTSFDKLQPKVEHILVYSKHNHFNLYEKGKKDYPEHDENGPFRYYKIEVMNSSGTRGRDTMIFPILGINPPKNRQWKVGQDTVDMYQNRKDLLLLNGAPTFKIRPEDEKSEITEPFWGFIPKEIGTAESGKKELNDILFPRDPGFETVKPVEVIEKLIFHASKRNSVILDFFAGSGTSLESVLKANIDFNGERQCIIIQNPEKTFNLVDGKQVAKKGYETTYNAGFKYISEITYERTQRVMLGYTNSKGEKVEGLGNSLKYYRTAFVGEHNEQFANDADRIKLAQKAGCLLALSENTLDEILTTEFYQLYTDGKRYTAIYFNEDPEMFPDFVEEIESHKTTSTKFVVYVYSEGNPEIYENEFDDLRNIDIKAIPYPILQIYKTLNEAK